MAKQNINVGTAANDKKGDSLRAAFVKVNANFTELYTELGLVVDANLNLGAFEFAGSTLSTTDSSAIVIDQATTITSNLSVGGDLLPQTANGGDLGSSTLPWRSLYVSNNTIFIGGVALGVDSQGNLLVGGQSIADVGTAAWNSITGKPTFATVATSGAYADLTDKPTLFDGAYSSLSGQPALFSGSYADLTNKPNLAGTYQFSVAADDSTQRVISTDEVIKFIGAGGVTTASDAEGNITITGSGGSTLVNGAYTVSLGSTGILTFPNGALKIADNKIRNVNESVGLVLGSEIEVTVAKTVISNGLTDTEGPSNQHIFEVGSTRIFSAYQVINTLGDGEGGPSLTGQQLTELTSTGFKIGYRVINDLGEGEPLTSFSGWTFGTVGQSQAITFPDGTIQTTAPESFSFSVAADDSTQRAVSNNELVKFIGAGGITTASDAEGNITINYVQGDIRSDSNINIEINLADSTLRRWQFGEDGALTFPDGTNYAGKDITLPQTLTGTANKVSWNFSDLMIGNSTTFLEWNLLSTDLSEFLIGTTNTATPFYFSFDGSGQTLGIITGGGIFGGGKLTFGSTAGSNAGDVNAIELKATNGDVYLTSTESVKITVDASDSSARVWLFDPTGNLTLPQGGNISEGGGFSGAIKLTPAGGANEYQALLIYPTAGEGDHIHLTAGGGTTELYLGDDLHYVKLASDGNIRIQADNGVNGAAWTFGTDGDLTIPGDIRSEGNINIEINLSDSTLRRWQFGEDGNLAVPGDINLSGGTISQYSQNGLTGLKLVANADQGQNVTIMGTGNNTFPILNYVGTTLSGITIGTPEGDWNFMNGNLTIPGDIKSDSNINIEINLSDSTLRRWQFGEDGNLTLPAGGTIAEGGGISGAIKLTPSGGANANQALLIYPTGFAEGDHLHLTAGGGTTELYLGNDYHYVKLVDGGNVEVKATTANFSDTAAWTFGTDGAISTTDPLIINVPNGVPTSVYNYSGDGGWNSPPYTNLATTTNGSGTGLTVNVSTAVGGYIDINAITINTPGTGYTAGDVIVITNENNLTGTFAIGVAGTRSWAFGTDGKLTVPGDIESTTSLDITTNHIPYYSNQFSGSQYISIANSSALQLGNATAWTIEAWVYITAYPVSGTMTIIEKDAQIGVSYSTYLLNIASDGKAAIYTGYGGGGDNNPTGKSVVSSTNLPLNQWVHLAAVWNGSNITLYQNGVSVGTVSAATTPITGEGGRAVNIGREDYLKYFTGKISNVRIVKNTAVYTGAFTPSTSPLTAIANTSLLTCNAATINVGTGTATVVNESPFGVYGDKTWAFGTDGSLTLPIGVSIDSSVSALYPKIIADSGKLFSVQGQGSTGSAALAWTVDPNAAGQYAAVAVTKVGGDNLAKVILQAQSDSGNEATVKLWKFDQTGAFTFPDATVQTTAWTGTTTGAITAESFNTDQITIVGNRISTTVTNANLEIETSGTGRVVINAIEDATTASTTRSVGYLGIPSANSSISRTLTIADSGKHTYITAAGVTLTIPAASSVAYPVGTTLTFIAGPSSTSVAIAITTDTMYLAGTGTTGTRTLAAHGMATAVKVSGTSSAGVWYINGTGLT